MNLKIKKNCKEILSSKNLKIIIWGCGKTGFSLINFLKKNHSIFPCDKNFNEEASKIAESTNGKFIEEADLKKVLNTCDFIIPSPGIILPNFIKKSEKLITELDLFSEFWSGKIFAITGSVGKTSTTTILYELLKRRFKNKVELGGNIGNPVFNLKEENRNNPVVLEVSNLQLEHTKIFSPNYCIWTNIHKNHLDLHKNFAGYVRAKSRMIINDPNKIEFFILEEKTEKILNKYKIKKPKNTEIFSKKIISVEDSLIPPFSFKENWKIAMLLLKKIGINFKIFLKNINSKNFSIPEHRIEWCGRLKNKIDFFNDSKATIMESVFSAVKKLKNENKKRDITLILGGKPKGIDRTEWLPIINKYAKNIIFFGEEKELFKKYSDEKKIKIEIINSLEESINYSVSITKENGIILFSPGGSSFDLFSSYEERGNKFKEYISQNFKLQF